MGRKVSAVKTKYIIKQAPSWEIVRNEGNDEKFNIPYQRPYSRVGTLDNQGEENPKLP
jgi:hypothetical protein